MSQVFAVITLVGVGLYGLSTLFSSSTPSTITTPASSAMPTAQGPFANGNSYTSYKGGKSNRQKHKGRLTRRKKH